MFDEATGRLELAVTAPLGSATFENLASNGSNAVTASQPTTYRTLQMKDLADRIDAPTQGHNDRVETTRNSSSKGSRSWVSKPVTLASSSLGTSSS